MELKIWKNNKGSLRLAIVKVMGQAPKVRKEIFKRVIIEEVLKDGVSQEGAGLTAGKLYKVAKKNLFPYPEE